MLRTRVVFIGLVATIGWGGASFAQSPSHVICNPKSQFTNIRSGPTAKETQIVDRLPNKAEIKILDRVKNPEGTHDWLKVQFKHSQSGALNTGYVYHEIVSLTCGDAAATTAQAAPAAASTPPAPPPAELVPELELTLRGHGDYVISASFSPDGRQIVTTSNDKTAKVWDAKTSVLVGTLSGHGSLHSAAFSPDGVRILTAHYDKTAKIWDIKTGTVLVTLTGHQRYVDSVAFSPDGARIVTASADDTAKIWDAKTGSVLTSLSGHRHGYTMRSAAFSPDGMRIVTASGDKTAKIWDAKTGNVLFTLSGHGDGVSSAAFSPDGMRIVTASGDKTAKIWDAKTGNVLFTLSGHGDGVSSAAFSPDGMRIVTASGDKTAKIWDAKTGNVLFTLSGHQQHVNSAAFSPDGFRIVTASFDKTANIWQLLTVEQRQERARKREAEQEILNKNMREKKIALAALDCERVKALDQLIQSDPQFELCLFSKHLKTGSARELYLAAAKFDAAKERDKAKKLYQAVVERFPNDDLALQAATRITAIADAERAEESQKAAAKTAADAAAAAATAAARASEVQSRPPSIPGGRAAGTRVYLCAGKGDCCEAIIVTPGEGKSKVEFPRACFPGGLLNPVFYRERQQEWFDNNVFRNQPM